MVIKDNGRPLLSRRVVNDELELAAPIDVIRNYDGKRAQGKRHTQAVLALARRRVNGLWARLRDDRPGQEQPPSHVLAA